MANSIQTKHVHDKYMNESTSVKFKPLLDLEKTKVTIYGTASAVSKQKTVKTNSLQKNQIMLKKRYLER